MQGATHAKPTAIPAPRDSARVGAGPTKAAKTAAAIKLKAMASPKRTGRDRRGLKSRPTPISRIHGLLNSGPYQSPPNAKAAIVAAATAIQLIGGMEVSYGRFEANRVAYRWNCPESQ